MAEERAKTEFLLCLRLPSRSLACYALFKVIIKSRLRFAFSSPFVLIIKAPKIVGSFVCCLVFESHFLLKNIEVNIAPPANRTKPQPEDSIVLVNF